MTFPYKTRIESIGAHLPTREVGTDEILSGCGRALNVPLQRLTGIVTRRRAGESEFAIDLAEHAVRDCMARSGVDPSEIGMLIATNISRWDAANKVYFEPPTACRLKRRLGLGSQTVAIDVSNACAGMWTGVYIADALIRTGEIGHAIVVSGEYITHLVDTAQKEIVDFLDSQLASLTLGDAGVAVMLSRGNQGDPGFVDLELYTLSKFSRFCIAKPTDKSHGGASMLTDSIKVTEAVIPHAAKHARHVLGRNQWDKDNIQHIVPHQTSTLTMKAGLREMRGLLNHDYSDRLINNLAHRGNTASNAHFLALHDAIHDGRINDNESVVFCISGSGQTTGTALYQVDDLPSRMKSPDSKKRLQDSDDSQVFPTQLEIESIGVVVHPGDDEPDSILLIAQAAEECLQGSQYDRKEVDLFIAACTYRSEFLMEPAIAALAAGELKMNDDREPDCEQSTFAFDLLNGEVGFLKAVYLATEMTRSERASQVLVAASEVENNIRRNPDQLMGIRPVASAVMLREATSESGFVNFGFRDFVDFAHLREVHAGWHEGGHRIYLTIDDQVELMSVMQDCLVEASGDFLSRHGMTIGDFDWVLTSQYSSQWIAQYGDRMSIAPSKLIDLGSDTEGNPSSSSFVMALRDGVRNGTFKRGQLILVAQVCPGVQAAFATYRV